VSAWPGPRHGNGRGRPCDPLGSGPDPHRPIPAVGDMCQRRIQRVPQAGDHRRQRIREVSIFAASVSVAAHDDVTAKNPGRVIAGRKLGALLGRDQGTDDGIAVAVEIRDDAFPVETRDTVRGSIRIKCGRGGGLGFHDRSDSNCLPPPNQSAFRSRRSSFSFRSTPQRYPDRDPSVRTTRWQGMATARALAPHAWATARTDFGWPIRSAISA
jgi:hypothetical protein